MNKDLSYQIAKHIVDKFVFLEKRELSPIAALFNDKFAINKKLALEIENKKEEKGIYGECIKIENSFLKILAVSLEEGEYAIIIQMNDFCPYGILLNLAENNYYFKFLYISDDKSEKWVDANILIQSKLLSGIEQIFSTIFTQDKLVDYDKMYKNLISFLNKMSEEI